MRDVIINTPWDPEGHYAALGIGPLADPAEIKRAYRFKVKLLHPDRNAAEHAEQDFIRVSEAYKILGNQDSRARYDSTARLPAPASLINPEDPDPEPLRCSRCGQISAQPRFLIFHQVKTFLWHCRRTTIRGIFCRECADRTAVLASTETWIKGWWGPLGPYRSIRALTINMKGGLCPRADNLWVILHQARAFLARGDKEVARALAEQAGAFTAGDADRKGIEAILAATRRRSRRPERRLINRWRPWRYAVLMQALPLAMLALALVVTPLGLILRGRTEIVSAAILVQPVQAGETRHVAVEMLKVRQGPAPGDPVLALLDRFTTVQVVETEADGQWARILTPNGLTGYVPARYLFGGSGDAPKRRWCQAQMGPAPGNGEVLMRRTGGEYRLAVRNGNRQDVVVRLKTPMGRTVMAFYVAGGAEAVISGIPDGSFRAVFATGSSYSRACSVFLDDMKSYLVPGFEARRQAALPAGKGVNATLELNPAGDGPNDSRPLPIEDYLDQ